MNDIFSLMYGEIFLKENNDNPLDNEKISLITKEYLDSRAKLDDKKRFLRLKREYLRIKSIKDYESVQEKLYAGKNKKEIISFELLRILNKNKDDADILEQVNNVKSILDLYDMDIPDELYIKIVNGIISLELSLGLKIGLFKELCIIFKDECKKIEEEYLTNKENVVNRK